MITTKEAPLGNEWEFSARNFDHNVQPGLKRREITQPVGLLQAVVQHVQERFIIEGWQFAALVQNLPTKSDYRHHLIAVFTHPSRTALIESWEHDVREFIKPEVERTDYNRPNIDPFWGQFKEDDPINEILRSTNFVAEGIRAGHHGIWVGQKSFWQTGVGLFDIDLQTYKQRISEVDGQIEALKAQARPLQERREALLALQVSKPKRLFTGT